MAQHALYTQFTAKPGQGRSLVEILARANDIVSKADGCKLYIINQDRDHEDTIWVTELWEKEEHHAISLTLDGCKELITEASLVLMGPPKQIVLKAITGKGVDE